MGEKGEYRDDKEVTGSFFSISSGGGFQPSGLTQDTVKGKVEAIDKDAKKITVSGTEYSLSDEAAQVEIAVDDEVEASVDGGVVKTLTKL